MRARRNHRPLSGSKNLVAELVCPCNQGVFSRDGMKGHRGEGGEECSCLVVERPETGGRDPVPPLHLPDHQFTVREKNHVSAPVPCSSQKSCDKSPVFGFVVCPRTKRKSLFFYHPSGTDKDVGTGRRARISPRCSVSITGEFRVDGLFSHAQLSGRTDMVLSVAPGRQSLNRFNRISVHGKAGRFGWVSYLSSLAYL